MFEMFLGYTEITLSVALLYSESLIKFNVNQQCDPRLTVAYLELMDLDIHLSWIYMI